MPRSRDADIEYFSDASVLDGETAVAWDPSDVIKADLVEASNDPASVGSPVNDAANDAMAPGFGDQVASDETLGVDTSPQWIAGGSGNDVLSGGAGNDIIGGGAGDDVLHGNAGNDTLIAQDGNDALVGGAGDDWLIGEAGNDRLAGGLGIDEMTGGSGRDAFVLDYNFATYDPTNPTTPDKITDFHVGSLHTSYASLDPESDRLDLSAALDAMGFTGTTALEAFGQGYLYVVQHGAAGEDGFGTTVYLGEFGDEFNGYRPAVAVADLVGVEAYELNCSGYVNGQYVSHFIV